MRHTLLKYVRISLLWFLIAAIFGFLLRLHSVTPLGESFNYQKVLQSHSHIAFLGWIFNMLFIFLIRQYPSVFSHTKLNHRILFISMQIAILLIATGLLIWGYKLVAILFLSIHAAITIIIAVKFLKKADKKLPGTLPIKLGLIMMIISYIGTLALGPISAMGYKFSDGYYFSIYFYMHFQYSGLFLFAGIGMLLNSFYSQNINFNIKKSEIYLFFAATIGALSISTLFMDPPKIMHITAFLSSALQIYVVAKVLFNNLNQSLIQKFSTQELIIPASLALMLFIKLISQLMAPFPLFTELAVSNRFTVIAFLHLNFLGLTTVTLLYLMDRYFISCSVYKSYIITFLAAFAISEIFLLITGLKIGGFSPIQMNYANTGAAFLLFFTVALLNVYCIAPVKFLGKFKCEHKPAKFIKKIISTKHL